MFLPSNILDSTTVLVVHAKQLKMNSYEPGPHELVTEGGQRGSHLGKKKVSSLNTNKTEKRDAKRNNKESLMQRINRTSLLRVRIEFFTPWKTIKILLVI